MNTWGQTLKLSIFGESHGRAVGVVIDGLPPGEAVDGENVEREMRRRAPGRDAYATARREEDRADILSGLYDGKTTGAPLCAVIYNTDARSGDYDTKLRPGHADWTALLKYGGHADMRGGGHFSGRLTAPLVFAGSLAKQILGRRGVSVYGRITRVGGVTDGERPHGSDEWENTAINDIPAYGNTAREEMKAEILRAKEVGDSVGGVVEAVAFGLPGGLGEPFFGSVESAVASMLFSIPAVKAVEFGGGFALSAMRGSVANDEPYVENGVIRTHTNHSGGVLGGITNGMPLVVRAAFKPTPSIAREQRTVDAATMEAAPLRIKGRHDPSIVPRAEPVVEAGLALCVLDLLLTDGAR